MGAGSRGDILTQATVYRRALKNKQRNCHSRNTSIQMAGYICTQIAFKHIISWHTFKNVTNIFNNIHICTAVNWLKYRCCALNTNHSNQSNLHTASNAVFIERIYLLGTSADWMPACHGRLYSCCGKGHRSGWCRNNGTEPRSSSSDICTVDIRRHDGDNSVI